MVWFSRIISVFLCCAILLGTTGCAYNSKNPLARDISYGATYGAAPGLLMLGIVGAAKNDDDESREKTQKEKDDEDKYFLICFAVLGGGLLLGTAIGTIVGIVDWIEENVSMPKNDFPDENYDPNKHP